MTRLVRSAPISLGAALFVLALFLAGVFTLFQPLTAQAQSVNPATVTISSQQTSVYEGQVVTYTLTRTGGTVGDELTVVLDTYETGKYNSTLTEHSVTFRPGATSADLTVLVPVDGDSEPGTNTFSAEIRCVNTLPYNCGTQWYADIEIDDPPQDSQFVGVWASATSTSEGGSATVNFTRTGGSTAQDLTVDFQVDDPEDRLRGNHWDPAPVIPTQVVIPAGSTTAAITLTFPDDQRDLPTAGLIVLSILPSASYVLYNGGTSVTLGVTDNDDAQELTFRWGWIGFDDSKWNPGESYLMDCPGGNVYYDCPGPAEGFFYYEDGRRFGFVNDIEEWWPAHFSVSRRAEDVGKTTTFVVRVEHNRGWESLRHAHWPIDPVTGNHYFEFPLTLTGNQRQVVGRIEVLDNGIPDPSGWEYSARIKRIEDSATGVALTASQEAQYWTVNDRQHTIRAYHRFWVDLDLKSGMPDPVAEGQQVTFTLEMGRFSNAFEPLEVQVRTWEPNHLPATGANPSVQVHTIIFPAVPITELFVVYVNRTETFTVTTTDDGVIEASDFLEVKILKSVDGKHNSRDKTRVRILDDDRPTISLAADATSITEGEPVTFTLTRVNTTAGELIVGVTVDDPGGFLEGNYASEAVEVPSSVVFAPGEVTKEVTLTPPDDYRDIPDSALTFTVAAEAGYDIVGPASLTVQVADNDVAPQVQISFNHAEVYEGDDLVLTIARIGEDKNPLEVEMTLGPVGNQRYSVTGLDPGQQSANIVYSLPDDQFKGPDTHYQATLHPGNPEFWVPTGATTINGAILDNDLYTVGVSAPDRSVNEGQVLYYLLTHDGHTGEQLQVNVRRSEIGSAVADSLLIDTSHTINAGSYGNLRGFPTTVYDGSDGTAVFTVEVLPGDGYTVDPNHSTAHIAVQDVDPLPVLGLRSSSSVEVSEGVGTAEIWVDLTSILPVPRQVEVDYEILEGSTAIDGEDFTASVGTLVFSPGETSKAVEVPILQDNLAEYTERFSVELKNPVFADLEDGATTLTAEVVIEDDEPFVTMEAAAAAVNEGTDAVFNLTRRRNTSDELAVYVQVSWEATYRETVIFPAGHATTKLAVPTEDDTTLQGSRTITALIIAPHTIAEPRTYLREGTFIQSITVLDDEVPGVRLYLEKGRVIEGQPVKFTLSRSASGGNRLGQLLTVSLSVDAPADYTSGSMPTSATIPAGVRSVEVEIPTIDDSVAEDTGELTVTVLDGAGYRPEYPSTYTFQIFDDDGSLPGVRVNAAETWVDEGEDVIFNVTRSGLVHDPLDARLRLHRIRSRVTAADLSDPTLGVTTPRDLIFYDDEEITVSFPAGISALTVTRSTTDDSLNYGNSTYHATVLAGPDDVYAAHYEHTASVWVQDDDRPTVAVTAPIEEIYGNPGQVYPGVEYEYPELFVPVTLTRTGDASGHILIRGNRLTTEYKPAPEQDVHKVRKPSLNLNDPGGYILPGETSFALQIEFPNKVNALGRSHGFTLIAPHYCPDDPEACGYGPQYTLGTPQEATVRLYANFMGVRIEADQTTVAEGGTAVFTLHRHGGKPDAMTRPLHVNVEVTQRGDYISGATPGTVTFLAGQATTTLSVPTSNDSTDERNGAITVTILEASNFDDDEYGYEVAQYYATPWGVYFATTAVTDDDDPLPNLSISDYEVDEEQGTFIFTMSLDAPNYQDPVSFDWTTRDDGSATEGVDYEATASSFTFAPGVTRLLSGIVITSDTVPEPDETFSIVLSNLTNAVPGDTTGTVTIRDDELDYGVTMFGTPGEFVEGEEVAFTLRRIPSIPASEFSSHILPSYPCFQAVRCLDLNGTPGNTALTLDLEVTQVGDFASQALPATVTFDPGERFAIVRIPTDDDSQTEAAGAITVRILSGSGYTTEFVGTVATATASILDNDLAISIDDAQAAESAGQMEFTVRLSAPAPRRVTVNAATVDGVATSHANVTATSLGRDFEAKSETITFEVGEQQKTFSVNLVDDSIQEMDETFSVVLSDPSQGPSLADDTAEGAIIDDEQPMVASVSRTYSIVDEGQAGVVSFMVTLSHATTTASERHPAVDWQAAAGTATEGEDYQAAEGRLVFPVGMTSGSVQVALIDDNLFEGELETFSVELIEQGRRLLTLSPTDASYEVSIRDNEILTAAITSNAEYVAEGGEAVFTVKLAGGVTTEDVQITFETGGDAQAGDDYGPPTGNIIFPPGNTTGSAGSLTIPAGLSSGTIAYLVFTDTVEEEDGETLEVQLFTVFDGLRGSGSGVSTTQNKASTNILDEDSLTVSIEGTPTVTEGGAATFTITLSTASEETVTVGWQTNQAGDTLEAGVTAEPDKDYTAASGDLAIQAGDTSGTITVQTTQDTLVEDTETFVVTVEEATQGTGTPPELVLLGADSATGTITDDDTAPDGLTMSVSPPMLTEASGSVDIPVTVTLDGTAQFTTDIPVTIEFVNRPNVLTNATLGEDYTANTVNTVILAGSSSVTATITITPVEDSIAEDDEIARLVAKSTALTGSDGMGIAIEDNDTEPVEVVLTVSPDTLYETSGSTPLNVTASLVGQASRQVDTVVTVTPGSGTATLGEDFESATLTLTIPTGEMSAAGTLVFTVTDDTIHEGDETLHISASVPGLAVTAADVTIKDDDPAPTSIGLSVTAVPISEGGGAVTLPVQAILLGGGTRAEDTTVDLRLVDLTATLTDDYTAAWGTTALTIPAGEFSGHTTLTITPVQDTLHEESETVAVRGRNTDPGLPVNGVRLTIMDDDPAPTTIKLDIGADSISEGVGVTWLQVTATLEGNSTLLEDVRINTELASTTSNTRSFGGSLVSPLIIAAGESSASSEIAITNLNDDVDDSDETLELRGTASDPSLSVLPDQVVITDDDTFGVTIWPSSLSVREGRRQNYNISLNSEPTSDVTVTVDLPADAGFTVNPGVLTFTPQSWGTKYVYVRPTEDEDAADEPAAIITHTITSADTLYRDASAGSVSVTVRDDETAEVTVSKAALEIEEGASDTYTVVLDTEPAGDVTVTIEGVADTDVSLDKTILTFTDQDWDAAQTVTVTAEHDGDAVDEAVVTITHTVSSTADSAYDGVTTDSVAVTITDDDSVGVTVSKAALEIEEGTSDTYTVVLDTEPAGDVTVTIEGVADTDVSLDKTILTFTDQDWDTPQTVTVTAEHDGDAVDEAVVTITHTVSSTDDSTYQGVTADSVDVTLTDDDSVGVTISKAALEIEEGASDTYTVVLGTEPAGDVTVTIEGIADTDVSLDKTILTFTDQDWDAAQTVTVTAEHDGDAVDEAVVTITHTVSSTADSAYDGVTADGVAVTVTDDDSVGVTVSKAALEIEEGASDTYTVVLDTEPAGDVTVTIGGITDTDVSLDSPTRTGTRRRR